MCLLVYKLDCVHTKSSYEHSPNCTLLIQYGLKEALVCCFEVQINLQISSIHISEFPGDPPVRSPSQELVTAISMVLTFATALGDTAS